jgi:cation diffusion facilitator CzcD-associated flavoprotein CzcO
MTQTSQEEILDYLVRVAQKWQLYRHIRFNTSVEEAIWDESTKKWHTKVRVTGGKEAEIHESYTLTSNVVASGVGQLNVPAYPDIPDLDSFKGKKMHSARWDRTYSLEGKRVGIIGSGATAVQIIPEVAKVVKSLTVFQRQPNWVIPRQDSPVSPTWQAIYKYAPLVRTRKRAAQMDFRESFFDALIPDSPMAQFLQQACKDMMRAQLPDQPELWEKLTPHYPLGCKRVLITDDYFSTLNQPHVSLETDTIDHITEDGVAMKNGQTHHFDVLVLATGFRTVEFLYPIKVTGRNGAKIQDIWAKGAKAYYGVGVRDLPNFFVLYGPNTNLGHNSIILMIEAQARFISALIAPVLNGQVRSVTVKPSVLDAYNAEVQDRLKDSAFAHAAVQSWYKTKEGLITNNWCGTVIEYQKRLSTVQWNDWETEGGEGAGKSGTEHIGRVTEETVVSDKVLGALGLLASAGLAAAVAVAAGYGGRLRLLK